MRITRIGLRRAQRAGTLRAMGYAILDNSWKINGIRVVERPDGALAVRMPQQRTHAGLKDVAHPVTPSDRQAIHQAVLAAYAELRAHPEEDLVTYHPAAS